MFDTFDVIVPKLLPLPELSIRHRETAFGLDDTRGVYFREVRLGRVVQAHVAFSNVEASAGSADRADWDVVLLHAEANAAAEHDGAWAGFLDALRALLEQHARWRVTCESDRDQYPVSRLSLDPTTLVELLDSYRTTHHFPIAFFSDSSDNRATT